MLVYFLPNHHTAKVLENPVYTLKDLIKFIQTLDFEKFMEHQDRIPFMLGEKAGDVNLFWAPIVESKFKYKFCVCAI